MREFELPRPLRIAASIAALAGLSAIACERPSSRVLPEPVTRSSPTSPARQSNSSFEVLARKNTLEYWLSLLEFNMYEPIQQQTATGFRQMELTVTESINPDDLIAGRLRIGQDDMISVAWNASFKYPLHTRTSASWRGEIEMKNLTISIPSVKTLAPVDKANEIDWQGKVDIGLIYRCRASRASNPLPASFSSWRNDTRSFTAVSQNGIWQISIRHKLGPGAEYLAGLPAPFVALEKGC